MTNTKNTKFGKRGLRKLAILLTVMAGSVVAIAQPAGAVTWLDNGEKVVGDCTLKTHIVADRVDGMDWVKARAELSCSRRHDFTIKSTLKGTQGAFIWELPSTTGSYSNSFGNPSTPKYNSGARCSLNTIY